MTEPIKYDFFPLELQDIERRFFVVLIKEVTLETRFEDIDRTYKRGIYSFPTKKARNIFTKVCNDDKGMSVAFNFNREPETKG